MSSEMYLKKMKVNNIELEKIAFKPEQYPAPVLPEIALAGRSNVGKSSFINSMCNRKNIARTSSKPGKTRTLNFYKVENKFRFVDLPGYGYASASKQEIDSWAKAINKYLESRNNIEEIFLIIDLRHSPTENDKMMYDYILAKGYSGYVIATKADKVKKSEISKNKEIILKKLNMADKNKLVIYSSEEKTNKNIAWKIIDEILIKSSSI